MCNVFCSVLVDCSLFVWSDSEFYYVLFTSGFERVFFYKIAVCGTCVGCWEALSGSLLYKSVVHVFMLLLMVSIITVGEEEGMEGGKWKGGEGVCRE